ncbi:hypothetical protein ASF60_19810 [Methylobacterium sp. Leaf113]|uniref:hypothetical protein n=1 Tax=Methylobacterium sp. Leaf113 TaxID=1736259 RepID=UPI0006FF16A1|nr:hypothetical protein [Methylobacterium sp. Leaf113]KQP89369.1 hypothetical protein ASF60_19810 [Methylobacterium sp. Leaf113]
MTASLPASFVRFDPQRRASSPGLTATVREMIGAVEAFELERHPRIRARGASKRERFHEALEAIACNVAGLALDPLGRPLAVPRANNAMWDRSRYANPLYGQTFRDALGLMEDPALGLVETVTQGFNYRGGASAPSTIQPTSAFNSLFLPSSVTWDGFRREREHEVLIKRAPKAPGAEQGELEEYRDDAHSRGLRHEVECINEWLTAAPFWLLPADGGLGLTPSGQPYDPTRRTVRRIFGNGRWDQGGRLYGGFWMTMPRETRFRRLRIASRQHPAGEPVANVDFRQFNLRAAYAHVNLRPPGGDLYDVRGDGSCRDGFKVLINAMLYASEPTVRLPEDAQRVFPAGTKAREVVAEVLHFHRPIADLFGTGLGFRMTAIESTILVEALAILFKQGITALPLHDAVLVAASEAGRAQDAMEAAATFFAEEFRARPAIEYSPFSSVT